MSGIAYAIFACGFVILAIIVKLALRFDAEAWLTTDLRRGDLYALIDVASGLRPDGLTPGQARRLEARGMVRIYGERHFRATLKGRLALRLRSAVRQAVHS